MTVDPTNEAIGIMITAWSDDFEPNSFSKTNRSSVWVKTVTIRTRNEILKQSFRSTYPIAIGKKGDDHDEVERQLATDLARLKSGKLGRFYCGKLKKEVKLYCDLFATLQDQPERRAANKLVAGNSIYGA